jgi:hypothetical protein
MISFASRVTQGAFSGDTERLDGTSDYLRIWISIGHFEFRACFIQTQMHLRLASLIPRQGRAGSEERCYRRDVRVEEWPLTMIGNRSWSESSSCPVANLLLLLRSTEDAL